MSQIAFILPVRGGSGGAHSVMQEASALRDLGINVKILVNKDNMPAFTANYDRYNWIKQDVLDFSSAADLANKTKGCDVLIATTNTSVHTIAEAAKVGRLRARMAYYVQDYEPLFYEFGSTDHIRALASFSALPDCIYFAKTRWLCDVVHAAHGHQVNLVVPSIDHNIYRPTARTIRSPLVVCAMIRPSTPRRAPRRTIAALERVKLRLGSRAAAVIFGADDKEIERFNIVLPNNIQNLGKLKQTEVANVLQHADVFLDLSDYQAFGRTAAEAMACGCISLAPSLGGAGDFIEDGVSGFLVDTCDPIAIDDALRRVFTMSREEIQQMRIAALEAVSRFTPVRAAISEIRALGLN